MDTIREIIEDAAESKWGKSGKYMVDIGFFIINTAQNRRVIRKQKLNIFRNKSYDMSYLYNEVILKNFVIRNFRYYKSNENISIRKVKAEIESKRYFQRNIIITGQAGMGKSTALKWLFLNSNVHKCNYIYLYAKMFDERESLDEVLMDIQEIIPYDKSSIIFFDGLDELKCIRGNVYEFNKFISFFDKESNHEFNKPDCKFVISTRPEHFGFNNLIIKKNSEQSLNNYLIIELPELTKKEALKICKSIKKLYQFDKKRGISNFTNKWPSKEMKNIILNEKEYIKILKKYLNVMTESNSLLNIPLLCRYAYQIICDWYIGEQDSNNQICYTQSDKIKRIIECCIKWEFHDRYTYQTEGGVGKDFLEKYKNRIWDFLTDIAGIMEKNKFIDKEQWGNLKSLKEIQELNEAYCVLQEVKYKGEKEKICFIHNTFYNYFLARYYALQIKENNIKYEDKLFFLLRSNSEFSVMYIEQIMNGSNQLIRKICEELLMIENGNIEKIAGYANGTLRFLYLPLVSFTIEEFLYVFPYGNFEYNGILFNRTKLDSLRSSGILDIEDSTFITECNQNVISRNNYITGVQLNLSSTENYKLISFFYFVYKNGRFDELNGNRKFDYKLYQDFLDQLLIQTKITYDDFMLNKPEVLLSLKKFFERIKLEEEREQLELFSLIKGIIKFLGDDKKFWGIFDDSQSLIVVYQMIPENEEKISDIFNKGRLIDSVSYITSYGICKSYWAGEAILVDKGIFQKINNVSFIFNANSDTVTTFPPDGLYTYYTVHNKIVKLIKYKINNPDLWIRKYYNTLVYVVQEKLTDVSNYLENSPNEKMSLYFSDEELFVFYILEEGEKMTNIAKDTLKLCEKYQHLEGIKFRKYLLLEDISFNGSDLEAVYEYAEGFIWI